MIQVERWSRRVNYLTAKELLCVDKNALRYPGQTRNSRLRLRAQPCPSENVDLLEHGRKAPRGPTSWTAWKHPRLAKSPPARLLIEDVASPSKKITPVGTRGVCRHAIEPIGAENPSSV